MIQASTGMNDRVLEDVAIVDWLWGSSSCPYVVYLPGKRAGYDAVREN